MPSLGAPIVMLSVCLKYFVENNILIVVMACSVSFSFKLKDGDGRAGFVIQRNQLRFLVVGHAWQVSLSGHFLTVRSEANIVNCSSAYLHCPSTDGQKGFQKELQGDQQLRQENRRSYQTKNKMRFRFFSILALHGLRWRLMTFEPYAIYRTIQWAALNTQRSQFQCSGDKIILRRGLHRYRSISQRPPSSATLLHFSHVFVGFPNNIIEGI